MTRQSDNRYVARALALPEIATIGATEAEAVAQLQAILADMHTHSHIVDVELPLPDTVEQNPLARFVGMWADDADWDLFQQAIAEQRRESDVLAQPE